MARGGYRPGAGRPAGVGGADLVVRETERELAKGKAGTPKFDTALDYAMHVINDPLADVGDKVRLAIAAMPFQHARLAETKPGKKELAQRAAETAGVGTDWGDDLSTPTIDDRLN